MVSAVTGGTPVGGVSGWGVVVMVTTDWVAAGAGTWAASMGRSQNLFRALWRSLSKEVKEQVGTDQFGNKYYYIPEYKNWRGEMRARAAVACSVNEWEVRASR